MGTAWQMGTGVRITVPFRFLKAFLFPSRVLLLMTYRCIVRGRQARQVVGEMYILMRLRYCEIQCVFRDR